MVGPLACGITYYFAIRAYDEMGNASDISNVVSGTHACVGGNPECELAENSMAVLDPGANALNEGPQTGVILTKDGATVALAHRDEVGKWLKIEVFDTQGRRVQVLHDGPFGIHAKQIHWPFATDPGRRLRQGVYFVRVRLDAREWRQPVVVIN